jgi:hypothetical protein
MLRLFVLSIFIVASASAADYLSDIKPLLKARCYACHGALKQKADLRLDTAATARLAKDVIARVSTADLDQRMPPEGEGSALSTEEIAKLRDWIDAGSPGPADEQPQSDPRLHWAYQPPRSRGQSIDALLAARLTSQGLQPQADIAPELWLRRVYLDLIGLPPTPEQLADFLAHPESASHIVDQLLANPQHGERWGRHFMDLWRYSDPYGLGAQLRHSQRHLWHWRDWIIESVNTDKGYDLMLRQMLAADEIDPTDQANLRATGYLARSYYLFNRTTWLDSTIEHTSRAFMGMTMQCVKCHDHKYDPLEHADYYRMRAVFEPMHVRLDPQPGQPDLAKDGLPRVFDLHLDRATYRHLRGDEKQEDKATPLPADIPRVLRFADYAPTKLSLPTAATRPSTQSFVATDHLRSAERVHAASPSKVTAANLTLVKAIIAADRDPKLATAAAKAEAQHIIAQSEATLANKKSDKKARATAAQKMTAAKRTLTHPSSTYTPLPATLKAQEGPDDDAAATVQTYPETSTGRRLAFAQWLTDSRHPLTARVIVNHVWARHFGSPIVASVDDFGLRSPAPLHQDILDTLASEFMASGWSFKTLHRRLVLSALYRRGSSLINADATTLQRDPDNAYLWHMNPRRLESQAVRDTLLHIAGRLDNTVGGPTIAPEKSESSPRRSLYFEHSPNTEHRFLGTFDNADPLECYRRNESVVPQQALALTNSGLSHDTAAALAKKLAPVADDLFIQAAFLTLLSRAPNDAELTTSREGLTAMKGNRVLFLHAMLSHNDFVTVR